MYSKRVGLDSLILHNSWSGPKLPIFPIFPLKEIDLFFFIKVSSKPQGLSNFFHIIFSSIRHNRISCSAGLVLIPEVLTNDLEVAILFLILVPTYNTNIMQKI